MRLCIQLWPEVKFCCEFVIGYRLLFWQLPWATASPQGGLQTPRGREGGSPVFRLQGLLPIDAGPEHCEFMIEAADRSTEARRVYEP